MPKDQFKTRLEIAKKKASKRNLDNTFGTKPWLILIFFFVGVVAGITNVIRSAKNMQK